MIQVDPIPCLRCDSNQDAFECGGGSNLITKEGFFQLKLAEVQYSDTFIQCDKMAGQEVCLRNDICAEGYAGHLCKHCDAGFFKDFDGSCQQCMLKISFFNLLHFAVQCLTFALIIYIMYNLIAFYHQTGKIVDSFYLFKNLINYFIIFGLIAEAFQQTLLA